MELKKEVNTRAAPVYKQFFSKIRNLKVMLIGLRGMGVEIAKNLLLSEISELAIYDPTVCQIQDMGSNFYLSEKSCGTIKRVPAIIDKLKALNPHSSVKDISQENVMEIASQYSIVIITEFVIKPKEIFALNEQCRKKGIGFIYSFAWGLLCSLFVDFGENFTIQDPNSIEPKSYPISCISNQNPAIIILDKAHSYGDDINVVISEVCGMEEINGIPAKIKLISTNSLKTNIDSTKFGVYKNGGIITEVKIPETIHFRSLEECLNNPFDKSGFLQQIELRNKPEYLKQLHIAVYAIFKFVEGHNELPRLHSFDDAQELLIIANKINESFKGRHHVASINEHIIINTAFYCRAEITSQTTFYGGIAAQEALKIVGKFTPIQQLLHYDCFESLSLNFPSSPPLNRYHDYCAIYGENVEKWKKLKLLMVGAGALGCEMLKGLALMGISTQGELTVTDMDSIEESNLSRQFLFHPKNIGKLKSVSAVEEVTNMNPEVKYIAKSSKVDESTKDEFNGKYWSELNAVIAAVDNVEARKFLDSQCAYYLKPFLESGTLGTVCNTDVIIPGLTISYSEIRNPTPENIPMCTLKLFPYLIEHCIEWGRSIFEKEFSNTPSELISLIKNEEGFIKEMYNEVLGFNVVKRLEIIKRLLIIKSKGVKECIQYGYEKFYEYYNHAIHTLLQLHPESNFWVGAKRMPIVAKFSIDDKLHVDFIKYFTLNLMQVLHFKCDEALLESEIIGVLKLHEPIPFEFNNVVAQSILKTEATEKDGKECTLSSSKWSENETHSVKSLLNELIEMKKGISIDKITAAAFEKDVDENHHIDFIHCASMIRAINYKIQVCDRAKSHLIAGKIIPAIITTTATIIGALLNEFIKVVNGCNKLNLFKNMNADLSVGNFMITEPPNPIKNVSSKFDEVLAAPTKAIPEGFTIYDKIVIKSPLNFCDFIDHIHKYISDTLKDPTTIVIRMISTAEGILYNKFTQKVIPTSLIEERYAEINKKPIDPKKEYLQVFVDAVLSTDSKVHILLPKIIYLLK